MACINNKLNRIFDDSSGKDDREEDVIKNIIHQDLNSGGKKKAANVSSHTADCLSHYRNPSTSRPNKVHTVDEDEDETNLVKSFIKSDFESMSGTSSQQHNKGDNKPSSGKSRKRRQNHSTSGSSRRNYKQKNEDTPFDSWNEMNEIRQHLVEQALHGSSFDPTPLRFMKGSHRLSPDSTASSVNELHSSSFSSPSNTSLPPLASPQLPSHTNSNHLPNAQQFYHLQLLYQKHMLDYYRNLLAANYAMGPSELNQGQLLLALLFFFFFFFFFFLFVWLCLAFLLQKICLLSPI